MPQKNDSAAGGAKLTVEELTAADHSVLSEAFGLKVAEAVLSQGEHDPFLVAPIRGFLEALLHGVTPVEVDLTPQEFKDAEQWPEIYHTPEGFLQSIWATRIYERFVQSEGWKMWPENPLRGTLKSVDTGKFVPALVNSEERSFLSIELGILVKIFVSYRGEVSTAIYGRETPKDINDLIDLIEDYVTLPDPYEGKIVKLEGSKIKTLEIDLGEISGYAEDVEAAVSWMSSIADSDVRKQLTEANLPAKAGLLLEGPPGSGKTTLARRIAAELSGETTVVYATPETQVETVFSFADRYEPVLIILEDVESFFGERGQSDFSSFLNELDGIDQSGGKMVLATSNDSSEFDEAVRRPGRLERRAVIAQVQDGAHAAMVLARLPRESSETIEQLAEIILQKSGSRPVTPAIIDSLARHAIMLKLSGDGLIGYARESWEPHYSGESYI